MNKDFRPEIEADSLRSPQNEKSPCGSSQIEI